MVALKMPVFCFIFPTEYFIAINPDKTHQYSCISQPSVVKEAECLADVTVPAISMYLCKIKPHQRSGALGSTTTACPSLQQKPSLHSQPNPSWKQPRIALGRTLSKLLAMQ